MPSLLEDLLKCPNSYKSIALYYNALVDIRKREWFGVV